MYGLQETLSNIDRLKAQVEKATQAGKSTPITMESLEMVEKMARNIHGDYSQGKATIQEAITTTDAVKLIPKVIEGKLREARIFRNKILQYSKSRRRKLCGIRYTSCW